MPGFGEDSRYGRRSSVVAPKQPPDYDYGELPMRPPAAPMPRSAGLPQIEAPPDASIERMDQDTIADNYMLQRLAALGLRSGDVDRVTPGWGQGFTATGATGSGPAQPSTTKFGTAMIRPGAFAVGGVDPSQRQFMVERGNQIAEKSQRDLSNFLNINAPTGTRDNYGTTDPLQDARIRAARADAAARENAAMGPLPEITVDDPQQVELAGGQAAYNAQKLAEARLAAAVSPVGQQALEQETRAKGISGAAPYAMSIDAGEDARDAFLQFLFPTLQKQGASREDIALIAAATKKNPEEVLALLSAQGIKVR